MVVVVVVVGGGGVVVVIGDVVVEETGEGKVVVVAGDIEVVVMAGSVPGAGGKPDASTTYVVPKESVISPESEMKILGGTSPLSSSWKNQKLISSSTTDP